MQEQVLLPFINEGKISNAIRKLAKQLHKDYHDKNPMLIVVLKGAYIFAADLTRQLNFKYNLEFVRMATYQGTVSTLDVDIAWVPVVNGRDVLIVEDIVDTGKSMAALTKLLTQYGAKSVKICALLDKPCRREVANIKPDYRCFEIGNVFVVGYGLDLDEEYRGISTLCSVGTKAEAREDASTGENTHA